MTKVAASETSRRDRVVGASPLTQRIYRAVLKANRPITAAEIYQQIKDVPGFSTDTSLWWQRRNGSRLGTTRFIAAEAGLRRVRDRINYLVKDEILTSDGRKGKGIEASYTAGRPPKGFRRHLHPGQRFGWYDLDVAAEDQRNVDRQALYELRHQIKAELAKPRLAAAMRRLLTEVDRLLGKVELQ